MPDMTNLPAVQDGADAGIVGLEDFNPETDAATPTWKIIHDQAEFEDSLSGRRFKSALIVPLGTVKSRVLFPAEMVEGEGYFLCRSIDAKVGTPNLGEIGKFPWKVSGYARSDYLQEDEDGNAQPIALGCGSCGLAQWGSHPKNGSPWCNEVITLIGMQITPEGTFMPFLFQAKGSGITPMNNYLTPFFGRRVPLFTSYATISLIPQKRGTNSYAVPKLAQGDDTDPALRDLFVSTYLRIRTLLTTPRDDSGTPVEVTAKADADVAAAPVTTQPVRDVPEDEEPF